MDNSTYLQLYKQNKEKYLELLKTIDSSNSAKSSIKIQTGGGAWSTSSDGNDSTHDMLFDYNLLTVKDDELIHHSDLKSTNKALAKMFRDYEKDIKKYYKTKKNYKLLIPITSKNAEYFFVSQYHYLGIIIYCVKNGYEIHTDYLKKGLVMAYRAYIRLVNIREASGWRTWEDRKQSLIFEIKLLNHMINTAKKNVSQLKIDTEKDVSKQIQKILKSSKHTMDKIHLAHRKSKPTYSFQKYFIQPALDPNLLDFGTIMMGHEGRKYNRSKKGSKDKSQKRMRIAFIVSKSNNKKKWEPFETFEDIGSYLMDDQFMIDIYDKEYYKVMRY